MLGRTRGRPHIFDLSGEGARAAYRDYQESLADLRRDPANPNLRQETLRLGRLYSTLTRNRRGVTIYDEMALMNDIGAGAAGRGEVLASQ